MFALGWDYAFRDSAVAQRLWALSEGRSGGKESVPLSVRRLMAKVDARAQSLVLRLGAGYADQASAACGFAGQQCP